MIRTGLIGFGLGGRVFHAPFVSITPDMELTVVVQRGLWKQPFPPPSEQYPGVRIVESSEALISDPKIDLIVISTPSSTHYELAKAALMAGKHVVVDKPLTSTAAEARELTLLARNKGLKLVPFQNRRFDADFRTLENILDSGKLGRLVTFIGRFDRFRPGIRPGTWKETPDVANGLLFDLGPHVIDQPLALFGKPQSVTANIRSERDNSQIDDAFDITLQYSDLTVQVGASMVTADPAPRFLLHGTQGSFRKYGLDPQEPTLLAGQRPTKDGDWLPEVEADWGTLTIAPDPSDPKTVTSEKIRSENGDYRLFYKNVAASIAEGEPLIITPEHGYRIIRTLELARQSHAEKRTIPFSDTDWECM